jgi:AcrR family transcriptional regulator
VVPAGPRQLEQATTTRAALVAVGRRLFVTRGYFDTGTEEIVAAASVTRGALYHHFVDKRDLFRAVFNVVGAEVLRVHTDALTAGAGPIEDPWERLRLGLQRFLTTAAENPEVQRITLIDGPAVLGWREWSALEERYALGLIEEAIRASVEGGLIVPVATRALGHMLLGVLNASALMVANAHEPESALRDASHALDVVLDGLRRPSPAPARGGRRRA